MASESARDALSDGFRQAIDNATGDERFFDPLYYLAGVPSLPDHLLRFANVSPADIPKEAAAELRKRLRIIKRKIRQRRADCERANNCEIIPEPPAGAEGL